MWHLSLSTGSGTSEGGEPLRQLPRNALMLAHLHFLGVEMLVICGIGAAVACMPLAMAGAAWGGEMQQGRRPAVSLCPQAVPGRHHRTGSG